MSTLQVVDLLLVLGATLRITRFIITDDLGLWWVRGPLYVWANDHEHDVGPMGWRTKVASGLTCPHCVGFWLGCVVLGSLWLVGGPGHAPDWWRYASGALTLNWCAAHINARMDSE